MPPDVQPGKSTQQDKGFSRRDFLKIVGGIPLGAKVAENAISAGEKLELETDIGKAIVRETGLSWRQLKFEVSLVSHFVTDRFEGKHVNEENPSKQIFLGEFKTGLLITDLKTDPDVDITSDKESLSSDYPSEGGLAEEMRRHVVLLKKLVEGGYTFVSTDADTYPLFYEPGVRHVAYSSILGKASLLLASGIGLSTALSFLISKKITKAKAIGLLGTIATMGIGLSMFDFSRDEEKWEKLGKSKGVELLSQAELFLEKMIEEDPNFLRYKEGIISFRDSVMALHAWQTIVSSVGKDDVGLDLVFMAGAAHGGSMRKFVKGIETLTGEIGVYADRLLDYVDELVEMVIIAETDEKSAYTPDYAAHILADYGRMFSEPSKIGPNPVFSIRSLACGKTVPSARGILWNRIDKMLNGLGGNKKDLIKEEMLNQAKIIMLNYWGETDIGLLKIEEELKKKEIQGQEFQLDFAKLVNWYDYRDYGYLEGVNIAIGNDLIVGDVQEEGKIYPVIRRFKKEEGAIITQDFVQMTRGGLIAGEKREYVSQGGEYVLEDDLALLQLWVDGETGGLIAPLVRNVRKGNKLSAGEVYVLEGEKDPFNAQVVWVSGG